MRGPGSSAVVAIVLSACWTGAAPAHAPANEAGAPARVVRVPRPKRSARAKRPPRRLTRVQRQFPPELRVVRDGAFACVRQHGVQVAHTLWLEVTIDGAGVVTAARATGFGAAEPCVIHALRTRTFRAYTGTTISLTIPWSSAHPSP